jgi:hypothetical protein
MFDPFQLQSFQHMSSPSQAFLSVPTVRNDFGNQRIVKRRNLYTGFNTVFKADTRF